MRSDDHDDDDHTYARLQEALRVAKTLEKEVLDERNKHQRTERELWEALLKVMSFSFYLNIYFPPKFMELPFFK